MTVFISMPHFLFRFLISRENKDPVFAKIAKINFFGPAIKRLIYMQETISKHYSVEYDFLSCPHSRQKVGKATERNAADEHPKRRV